MGKIIDNIIERVHKLYESKNIEWKPSDELVFNYGLKILPILITIPLMFIFLKWIFIDFMLTKKGFETTIIYCFIIIEIKPMILSAIEKMLTFNKEYKLYKEVDKEIKNEEKN